MGRHRSLRSLCAVADMLLAAVLVVAGALAVAGLLSPTGIGAPAAFGSALLTVTSGSMSPELRVGDAVVADVSVEPGELSLGDVIVFRSSSSPELLVTHRVVGVGTDDIGRRIFTTRGDANPAPDADAVDEEQVVGRVAGRLPKVGYVLAAADNAAVPVLFGAGAVLAHGALLMARSVDTPGAGRRRGESNVTKGTTT